jgi:general secretion pathway protein E
MLKKSDPIERILLRHNKINSKTFNELKEKNLHNGKYIGKVLVDHGYIHAQVLLDTLSKELGIPYLKKVDFENRELPVKGMDIPESFLREKMILPLEVIEGALRLVVFNPFDLYTIENLKVSLGMEVKICLASEEDILAAIELYYGQGGSAMDRMVGQIAKEEGGFENDEESAEHIRDMASEAPVIKLVNHIITRGIDLGASDIHLEPFAEDLILRYRVDGILHEVESPPKRLNSAITTRIKIMAKLDISERRLPQDGRIKLKIQGKDIDMRVSTLPTLYGESVVMRILDRGNLAVDLDFLGFPDKELKQFSALIRKPYGKLLVTGPTGSGKTTTLYAALEKINTSDKKIITIEDPVEYQLKGVNQIHVKPQIGLTFAQGLRSIVRQDPDVIMVGEIRDSETADISIQAALTGHMVFSTLHTNDAAGAVSRLLDMGVESYLLSSALLGVLAQRLVRIICNNCKEPIALPDQFIEEIGSDWKPGMTAYRGRGCEECNQTGFKGRVGIYELLVIDDDIRKLIITKASAHVIRDAGIQKGMRRLRDDGWHKVMKGITTVEEILRVTMNDQV